MKGFLFWIALFAVCCAVVYLLYLCGCLTVTSKRAVTFLGSSNWKAHHCGASFSSCTGYIRRVLKFKEDRPCRFTFSDRSTRGLVRVELLDKNGALLLRLDKNTPTGNILADKSGRYTLICRFQNADGGYRLDWT